MRKIYLKLLIGIVVLLWVIYFIQMLLASNINTNANTTFEAFTPKINGLYRPYVRKMDQHYESFIGDYGPKVISTKLRKWNIF